MIIDQNKKKNKNLKTDVLIVGGGTTGLFLAERLKKKFKNITILEKGSDVAIKRKNMHHKLNVIYHEGFQRNISIGLGGNSTLWGGQLAEFDKEDFQKNFNWGVNYSELKKYYRKIYKIFNIKFIEEKDFKKHTKQKKLKKKNLYSFYTHWLSEPNFKKYFSENITNSNIRIILKAEIIKLNFTNKNCNSIEYKINDKIKKIYPKIIILCCGPFNNAKVMLYHQSESPWKNNKYIGKYFQDHIGLHIGKLKILNKKKFDDLFANGYISNSKYQPKIKSRYRINNFNYGISGEIKNPDDKKNNSVNQILKNYISKKNLPNLLATTKLFNFKNFFLIKKIIYFILRKKILFNDYKKLTFYVQCEQKPIKSSCIRLTSKKRNNFTLDWKINGDEFYVIKKFVNDVNSYLSKNKIAKIDTKEFSKLNNESFKEKLRDTNHPSGGLLVSNSLKNKVLNINQKVENTKNLYVAGSSVFPKSSHANITLTALALTERLANYLITRY